VIEPNIETVNMLHSGKGGDGFKSSQHVVERHLKFLRQPGMSVVIGRFDPFDICRSGILHASNLLERERQFAVGGTLVVGVGEVTAQLVYGLVPLFSLDELISQTKADGCVPWFLLEHSCKDLNPG
jgi:hypothetical protein